MRRTSMQFERLFDACTGFWLKSQESAFQPESFREVLRATEALRMTIHGGCSECCYQFEISNRSTEL